MKKKCAFLIGYVWLFALMFLLVPITADAANVTSGVLGDNGGIQWTYDADSKTLTVTGEDTGVLGNYDDGSIFNSLCGEVESIAVKNCKLYDCSYLFSNLRNLHSITFENFDTSQVTNMYQMFYLCPNLTNLDMSGFDTSNVTNMVQMFEWCESLTSLDLSGFDTSQVTDMSNMFSICPSLIYLDVSGFDTSNVERMFGMFNCCESLTSLDVSSFDTSNVINMSLMFSCCSSLTDLDLSGFDTSQVMYMDSLFHWSSNLENLDISSFNLTNVVDLGFMFNLCDNLKSIKTPMTMSADQTIDLPGTFVDSNQIRTTVITKDFCKDILVKEGAFSKVKLSAFVERMYTVALGRTAETDGLAFYVERLLAGDSNGACLAESFLCSPEFKNKDHDNAQYVKVLYATFFDREPAAEEVSYWVGKINEGQSREFVLSGFVNSVEFDMLCAEYGISRGYLYQDGKPANPGLGRFAERLYTKALGRAGEKEGIEYWTLQIAGRACTPKEAAKSFFMSGEYVNKKTTNEQYIVNLYETFMDRNPETGGIPYWENLLNSGISREQVLEGFANSPEFAGIMASFGL